MSFLSTQTAPWKVLATSIRSSLVTQDSATGSYSKRVSWYSWELLRPPET